MIIATIAILTVFFAIGSVSPLLITDGMQEVVELKPTATHET